MILPPPLILRFPAKAFPKLVDDAEIRAIPLRGDDCGNQTAHINISRMKFGSRGCLTALLFCGVSVLAMSLNAEESRRELAFAGRWDLTVTDEATKRQMPSWLELNLDHDTWKARFVGRWGNVRPLPTVKINGDEIHFVSPKEEEGSKTDLVFDGKLRGKTLSGTAIGPDGARWKWTGRRAPALQPPGQVGWDKSLNLFNGRDFAGWHFDNPSKSSSWSVENDYLVNKTAGSNIITDKKFRDFKLHIEVNCPSNANSGIYLRGRYEVQVEDDSIEEPPSHHMGAIYGFLAPVPEQPRRPGAWQTFDIKLVGRYVTVVQNGQTVIANQEIHGITGGAIDSNEESPGSIYLQGDHGGIAYRNIVLTPAR